MAIETVGEGLGEHETRLRAQWASAPAVSVLDDDWLSTMIERREALVEARRRDWLASNPAKPGVATWISAVIAGIGAGAFFAAGHLGGWVIGGPWTPLLLQSALTCLTFCFLLILCRSNDRKQRVNLATVASWSDTSLGDLDLLPAINEDARG